MGEEEEREKKSDEIATHSEISEVREPNAMHPTHPTTDS